MKDEIVKKAVDIIYNLLTDFPCEAFEKYRLMKEFEERFKQELNRN